MTIKQQGGVFGRNPTYNDVSADTVTAGQINSLGAVVATGAGVFGDDVDVTGDIDSTGSVTLSGSLGVGTQSPSHKVHVPSGNIFAGSPVTSFPAVDTSGSGAGLMSAGLIAAVRNNYSLTLNRHTTTGSVAQFYYSGAFKGSISVTGSGTAYNTTSDYRLKENINPIQGAVNTVKSIKPVTYTFKSDGSLHDGFIAHELQEFYPHAVLGEKDAIDEEGNPEYQTVDYSRLTPILTAALQETLKKIDDLEARLRVLEAG